jgi:uncharacterized protein
MKNLSQRREDSKFYKKGKACVRVLGAALVLLIPVICIALEIPPPSGNYVNDYAGMLSPEAKQRLETNLRKFAAETSTQIVVAIFPSLEDESLEDFTNRMYETWKIGQKNNNNGVLLGIFQQERRVRIEVGYGLEGVLTDALSSQIIRNEFVPNFRSGNYDKGTENTVLAIEKAVRGEYTAPEKKTDQFPTAAAIVLIIFLLIVMSRFNRRGYTIGPVPRRAHYRRDGYDPGWMWPGGFGGVSPNDGAHEDSGGFGGFSGGGGLSGGGGASGSW